MCLPHTPPFPPCLKAPLMASTRLENYLTPFLMNIALKKSMVKNISHNYQKLYLISPPP